MAHKKVSDLEHKGFFYIEEERFRIIDHKLYYIVNNPYDTKILLGQKELNLHRAVLYLSNRFLNHTFYPRCVIYSDLILERERL